MADDVRIERRARLTHDEVDAVLRLVDDVTAHFGVRPLSEHVMLHLRYGGDSPARNFLLWHGADAAELGAYAHLDVTDSVAGPSAELAISPEHPGVGHGRQLLEAILDDLGGDARLRVWAHGQATGAAELVRSMGFRRERVLWQMRRSLFAPIPAPVWPAGVAVRTFVPGQDEAAWLEVNARAFADHPDQGSWTLDELLLREQEPWFDPAGFFLAERDGQLVGFHWTKTHGADEHGHEPLGEVYVVGVDPAMQGQGLGPALTAHGLVHLRARGLSQVMLYVDETNTSAIRTYERLGFARWDTDVCFLKE